MTLLQSIFMIPHRRYMLILAVVFLLDFVWLAFDPHDRGDWLLENVLVFLLIPVLVYSYLKFPLSRISYTCIFLFLVLHEVGAHFTYARVPYDELWQSLTGSSLNAALGWERNHFDRLVHFAYGLLLVYPVRELYCRIADTKGFWSYFFPLDLVMASSMVFELFEWAAAEVFGGDLGVAYLGTQGDVWDAHKDMLLATLGALLAMCVTMWINYRLQRDFAQEWSDSLKIKQQSPLGEDEIVRMLGNTKRRFFN